MNLHGSICLSDIPRDVIKRAANGKLYVNIQINERRETDRYGNTHNITCKPKRDEVVEGVNYYIGHAQQWQQPSPITAEDVAAAPPVTTNDTLPWEFDDGNYL